jgi:hypothetical protein
MAITLKMMDSYLSKLSLLAIATVALPVHAQEVWFAPNDDLARGPNRDQHFNYDFPHLFEPSRAWSANHRCIRDFADDGLRGRPRRRLNRINVFLKGRHIALAVGIDATLLDNPNRVPGECGFGITNTRLSIHVHVADKGDYYDIVDGLPQNQH